MISKADIRFYYFLGIGGIGMSALARWFHREGFGVVGYDRTPSALTHELEQEGMRVHYDDSPALLETLGMTAANTLVVRTPAVPTDTVLYRYFEAKGFSMCKRAEVLGHVANAMQPLCVAGTHGKTTTSTMLAHLLHATPEGVNAFLGGISNNYATNVLFSTQSQRVVVEADEYDRSFHQLRPYMAVITSVDADHLDIYGTEEAYREAFAHFTSLISGALVIKKGLPLQPRLQDGVRCYTYSMTEQADFYADAIRVENGTIRFDFHTPEQLIRNVELGVPVWVNIENAVAAMAVAWLCGVEASTLKTCMRTFAGVWRRFNVHVRTPKVVYIDDYAHHPAEIRSSLDSVKRVFPSHYGIVVFQPHLYTRTRDFADGFAQVLSSMDEVVLLPIYPAREQPIEGVTSEMLLARITCPRKRVVEKADLTAYLAERVAAIPQPVVVMSVGAGDIDRLIPDIKKILQS